MQLSDEYSYVPATSERCLEYGQVSIIYITDLKTLNGHFLSNFQYQVWREFSQETNSVTTSKLRIYHTQSRRYRSVWHLSWYEFNDQHCPKNLSQFLSKFPLKDLKNYFLTISLLFLEFLEELNSVRLASISEVPPEGNSNPPVLMHCNGGDRTGLTLVSDLLLFILDHNQVC